MAKALFGTHTTPRSVQLLDEIRSLRARVAELESALAAAQAAGEARERVGDLVEAESVKA